MGARIPSENVIEAVSQRAGADPLELPPLYEAIDPDALDSLLHGEGSEAAVDRVQFDYAGYSITVTVGGNIDVAPTTDVEAGSETTAAGTDD